MGDGLESLRVSELLERARALGAHADHLDELLDDEEPKLALTRLIRGWRTRAHSPDEVDLSADAAQLVAALSEAEDPDARLELIGRMVEVCGMASAAATAEAADAEDGPAQPAGPSVHLELAAAGAVEAASRLVVAEPALVHQGMLLLATLAAKRECAAWFAGSNAVPSIVEVIKRTEGPDVESLCASALANLAYPPDTEEGSTAVAKEILTAGAVRPLLNLLPALVRVSLSGKALGGPGNRTNVRAQQWAAAALCNLSMHGRRARAVLLDAGAFQTIADAVSWFSAASAGPGHSAGAEGQAVATQLLLGCLTNLAAFHEDPAELVDAGALDSAISVLEAASLLSPRGIRDNPLHEAAAALIRQTAEACGPESEDDRLSQLPRRLAKIAANRGAEAGSPLVSVACECAELFGQQQVVAKLELLSNSHEADDLPTDGEGVDAESETEPRQPEPEPTEPVPPSNTAELAELAEPPQPELEPEQQLEPEQEPEPEPEPELKDEPEEQAEQRGERGDVAAGELHLTEDQLLEVEALLEQRHEKEDRRLQELLTAFDAHAKGTGKVAKDDLMDTVSELGVTVPLAAVATFADQCDQDGDGSIDFEEFARAMHMLEHGERAMDRKIVALAQEKARTLQHRMTKVDSYAEGKELQLQYKKEMAQATQDLASERTRTRRKLDQRLQSRKKRFGRHGSRLSRTVTSTTSLGIVARMAAHEQQVREYLRTHHRDDLLPMVEKAVRPEEASPKAKDKSSAQPETSAPASPPRRKEPSQPSQPATPVAMPPPPRAARASPSPPPGWEQPSKARPRQKERAPDAKEVVKVAAHQSPPMGAMSLESYLGLAAARRNLSASHRKVRVTAKMRQEWKKKGQLLEL